MIAKDARIIENENAHNKELLNATLEIAEEERAKIARNVHDDLGMLLHTVKLHMTKARRNLNDGNIANEALESGSKIIDQTLDTIRIIAGDLLPGPLLNFGFIEGMKFLCSQINATKIITINLKTELEFVEMESKNAVHLYRLIKEVLSNIIKHTRASMVEMEIFKNGNMLNVILNHNGKGITNDAIKRLAESSKGIGLRSIMGRAQLINSSVQYVIVDDRKAKIIIETPLK